MRCESIKPLMIVGPDAGPSDVGKLPESPVLVVITAVWGEAKGLIEALGLDSSRPVPGMTVYGSADVLVGICGKGPESARRYCMNFARWLVQSGRSSEAVWINYGSAGSADHAPGTLVQGLGINAGEAADIRGFRTLELPDIPGVIVRTHDSPDSSYTGGMVHDMEAAGFVTGIGAALDNPETCILKLICDGPDRPWHEADRPRYQGLLDAANENMLRLVDIIRREKHVNG